MLYEVITTVINLSYPRDGDLRAAIVDVCDQAVASVRQGKTMIVLSDREIAEDKVPIHALLATGALHHRLIEEGLRCDANIVLESYNFV